MLTALLLAISSAYYLSSGIINPLNKMKEALKEGADGDLSKRIDVTSKDEVGSLALYYNKFIDTIAQYHLELLTREQELAASNKMFQLVLDTIPVRVFWKDTESNYQGCNRLFAGDANYGSIENVIGKTDYDFVDKNLADSFRKNDKLAMAKGRANRNEEEVSFAEDGHHEILETIKTPLYRRDGQLSGVLGIGRDITARKQAEMALLESEKKFRNLFENAQIGLFRTRVDNGLFLEANQRLVDMLGYDSREEVIGHLCVKDIYVEPERRSHMIAELKKQGEIKNYEAHFRKKDGAIWWGRFSGKLYEEEEYFEGVIADITENKQAEAEKAQLEEQYRQAQKVEAIGRLAGGVAHDMNNLLTPILGYGELVMADFSPDDRRRKSVEQMVRAGYRARDLVRQLLAFGRKQTLAYKPMNLNQALERFEKLLRRTIREDIALNIMPSTGIPTIKADIGQVEQVIMNLSVNAQDAMPNGGRLILETALVEIDEDEAAGRPGTKAGPYVMLSVRDTGFGIDEETQAHIFEPFFSTKGEQGTGLGLATVYGIIKQHEGNIWVYSQLGKGTTFKIYLPVSEEEHVENDEQKEVTGELKGSETILLVEDNEQVRNLGHTLLTKQGYTVLVAENGAEALVRLAVHDGTVHLLLTDVVMPRMNGKELFTKAVQKYPDLKVLYMSGYADDLINHHGILEENTAFIQKPFAVEGLAVKVREALG
jgi:PAS domain S-box-containing protein